MREKYNLSEIDDETLARAMSDPIMMDLDDPDINLGVNPLLRGHEKLTPDLNTISDDILARSMCEPVMMDFD